MRSKIYPLKNSLSQSRHLSHAMFLRDESMEWFVCFENDSSWITINDRDEQFCCRSCLSSKQSKTSQLWDSCRVVPFCLVFFENVAQTKRTNFKKSTWNFSFSLFFWHCIRCWPNWLIGVQVLLAVMLARVCRQVRSGYVKVLMLIRHNARHVRRLSFTC